MRKVALLWSAVALAGVATLGGMSPASAATTNGTITACSGIIDVKNAKITTYCGGWGGAEFRAWIECKSPLLPWTYTNVGPWRQAGKNITSSTNCGSSRFVDAGTDTRNDSG